MRFDYANFVDYAQMDKRMESTVIWGGENEKRNWHCRAGSDREKDHSAARAKSYTRFAYRGTLRCGDKRP